jgi:hypothetical protein
VARLNGTSLTMAVSNPNRKRNFMVAKPETVRRCLHRQWAYNARSRRRIDRSGAKRNAGATILTALTGCSNAGSKAQGGTMLRTIEDWKTVLRDKFPQDAAQRILRDIPHYRKGGGYECQDIEQLANALQAFASLRDEDRANGS